MDYIEPSEKEPVLTANFATPSVIFAAYQY